jgi:NAD+ diphosphatase
MDPLARSLRNGLVSDLLGREPIKRAESDWIERALSRSTSLVVPVKGEHCLFRCEPRICAALFPATGVMERTDPEKLVFLGRHGGRDYFALSVAEDEDAGWWLSRAEHLSFENLWRNGSRIETFEASLLAYARGMCHWHERSRYCGRCGGPTRSERAGHLRRCVNPMCAAAEFPRTDPAVIVLVHYAGYCLLGNKHGWPERRFSTIAGFVEPGESIEQAAVREVMEETGVEAASLEYHSSQPWPFPGSVMIGFHASAASRQIALNDDELRDARWFSREEVQAAKTGRGWLRLPSRISIARRLIEDWCDSE